MRVKFTLYTFFIALAMSVTTKLKANDWQLTIVPTVNATTVDAAVYIKTIGTSIPIGDCSIVLSFNTSALSAPSIINTGGINGTNNYTTQSNAYGSNYSVETLYSGSSGSGTIPSGSGNGTLIATLRFPITNYSASANFNYDLVNGFLSDDATNDMSSDATYSGGSGSNTALPVTLSRFSGKLVNHEVVLQWTTSSEINNNYFTVERSSDGKNFTPVMTKAGNGTTSEKHDYIAYDESPLGGTSFYRLKQTDYNGQTRSFNIITIRNTDVIPFAIESAAPTNFSNETTINYTVPGQAEVRMTVRNVAGKIISDEMISAAPGKNSKTIENTGAWQPGIYFVNMFYNGQMLSTKVIKN